MLYFTKKRISRILVPHQIGFLIVLSIFYIQGIDFFGWDKIGLMISFFGLGYSSDVWEQIGLQSYYVIGEWFTAVIIILYLLFPLLRWLFLKYRLGGTILLTSVFVANMNYMILSAHQGEFSITNGLMLFWMGMLFEEYKEILKSIHWLIISIVVAIVIVFMPNYILGLDYFPCFIVSILLFILLYKVKVNNMITRYICKYNYEIYLIHHRVQLILMSFLLNSNSTYLQVGICFLVLTGLIFLLSEKLQYISNLIINFKFFR